MTAYKDYFVLQLILRQQILSIRLNAVLVNLHTNCTARAEVNPVTTIDLHADYCDGYNHTPRGRMVIVDMWTNEVLC